MSVPGLDKHIVTGDNSDLNGVPHTNGFSSNGDLDEAKEASAYDAARVSKPNGHEAAAQSVIASHPKEATN